MTEAHLKPVSPSADLSAEDEYSLVTRAKADDEYAKMEIALLPPEQADRLQAELRESGVSLD